jgi:hypothetical protein
MHELPCGLQFLPMAYGRCLRPALYSSLRSSPSHPTGVSALRVTIAIASARFARKQWGPRRSTAKSRRLFRNELEDPPRDSNCILSQIAAGTERLLASKLGPGNQRARTASEDGKGKAPPSARRMWLVALTFFGTRRTALPSVRAELSRKSTRREPSVSKIVGETS